MADTPEEDEAETWDLQEGPDFIHLEGPPPTPESSAAFLLVLLLVTRPPGTSWVARVGPVVTSMTLIDRGGLEWTEDTFVRATVGRGVFTPPRVPRDEFSSSTISAIDILRRVGIAEERRGDVGEGSSSK